MTPSFPASRAELIAPHSFPRAFRGHPVEQVSTAVSAATKSAHGASLEIGETVYFLVAGKLEDERGRLHPEQELRMQVVDIEQGEGRWP